MNKNLFKSAPSSSAPIADVVNEAGGLAFSMSDKANLAKIVMVGCLANTFYLNAEQQLDKVLELCAKVEPKFIAQTAVYARQKSFMKDTTALLCAVLAARDPATLKKIFSKVIDNGKMLRNFVTILRSGKTGRKAFGTSVKKMVQKWFETRSDSQLFRDSVGEEGASLADCIKLCHPAPITKERDALYAYLIGKKVVDSADQMVKNQKTGRVETVLLSDLPACVKEFELFKKNGGAVPNVEFRLLTALKLGKEEWTKIAKDAPYQMSRINLNTFQRHGVFEDPAMVHLVAERLANVDLVKKNRVFPYQVFAAFKNVGSEIPVKITNALQDAAEIATANIPEINGKVYICIDVSGSMHSPITGNRGTATSKVTYLDAAALFAAAIMRKNPEAELIAFSDHVVPCKINARDSIMTNATKLTGLPAGGTACGEPMKLLNTKKAKADMVIYLSDNESWADAASDSRGQNHYFARTTSLAHEWELFKKNNKSAKLVCLDIAPGNTTQFRDNKDTLNVSGFSDNIFDIISAFSNNELGDEHFVTAIEKIDIEN